MVVRHLSNDDMKERVAKTFPVQAAEFVADKGYAGPLYNDFNWGGYLIWALPHLPVAIDGRTNSSHTICTGMRTRSAILS